MTSIHACIPTGLSEAVLAAKRRGETFGGALIADVEQQPPKTTKPCSSSSARIREPPYVTIPYNNNSRNAAEYDYNSDTETDDEASASKENDPSHSPSPVAPQIPRTSTSIKRPLSDLPTPTEPQFDEENSLGISSSERNIANNMAPFPSPYELNTEAPPKALKLAERTRSVNFTSRGVQDGDMDELVMMPYDIKAGEADNVPAAKRRCSGGKENATGGLGLERTTTVTARSVGGSGNAATTKQVCIASRKPALASIAGSKGNRPRVGLRRL